MAKKPAQKTKTAEKAHTGAVAEQAQNTGAVAKRGPTTQIPAETTPPAGLRFRLPFPRKWCEHYGIGPVAWAFFCDSIWPSAKTTEGVCMAIAYCHARKLDPTKKVIHVVPVWSKSANCEVEGVWPGIAEVRITATRTGVYAGKDAIELGPMVERTFKSKVDKWSGPSGQRSKTVEEKDVTLKYPEWARLTVYKIVQGIVCKFVGPQVLWEEAYATESKDSEAPNAMWADRKQGQLEKCAEAASLRSAFPEELGGELTAEEMWGRVVEVPAPAMPPIPPAIEGEARPPAGRGSEFQRRPQAPAATEAPEASSEALKPAQTGGTGGDGRPEPPPLGEALEGQEAGPGPDEPSPMAIALLDAILADGREKLPTVKTSLELSQLRDLVEQELPPESQHLKDWIKDCETRQAELLAATKKK